MYKNKKRRKHNNLNEDQVQQIKDDACEAYHCGDSTNPYPKHSDAWEIWDEKYRQAAAFFEG